MDSYVTRSAVDEVIDVFKSYTEKTKAETGKKTNKLPLTDSTKDDKMFLQITFKSTPINRTTFINNYRSLPYPYLNLRQVDATICLIVMDRNRKPLPDREYDLRITKEYYQDRLRRAGVKEDIIKHRLFILPMRELLTEYRLPQLKRRLAISYDVFMADSRLLKGRFKLLPKFLGHKFWIEKKNFPINVDLKFKGAILKKSFDRALATCSLYITGHGPDTSVQFGICDQSKRELSANLEFITKCIYKTYGKSIQLLKIKSTRSIAIPFYADLNRPTEDTLALIPRTTGLNSEPIIDDHPFSDKVKVSVYPTGRIEIEKPENFTPDSDDEDLFGEQIEDDEGKQKVKKR